LLRFLLLSAPFAYTSAAAHNVPSGQNFGHFRPFSLREERTMKLIPLPSNLNRLAIEEIGVEEIAVVYEEAMTYFMLLTAKALETPGFPAAIAEKVTGQKLRLLATLIKGVADNRALTELHADDPENKRKQR
jgi:hypothetical protein